MRRPQTWQRFLIYAAMGWVVEVIFTGIGSIMRQDWNLTAHTYLWMFPIYGSAALAMEWLHNRLRTRSIALRGVSYLALIYAMEYSSGWLLCQLLGECPWEYPSGILTLHGFIRLDFAPAWLALGLLFERVHDWLAPVVEQPLLVLLRKRQAR